MVVLCVAPVASRGFLLVLIMRLPRHFIQEKKVYLDKNTVFFYHTPMKTPAEIILHYLTLHKMKKIDFCKRCKIHRSSLDKYLKGEPIHPFKAKNIEIGTFFEIKASELVK